MDELVVQGEISSRILTLRGKQVMLVRDFSEIYQVENRVLNQAVKRNLDRFPDDFIFQLSKEEFENLKSQIVISSSEHGGVRKMPHAFTEEGIYMLATVLRSPIATQTSISIIRTFKKLREFSNHYNALAKQLITIDRKHDKHYKELKKALDTLISKSEAVDIANIGFLK